MVLSQYVLYSMAGNCWMVSNVQLIPTPKASVQSYDLSFKNKKTKQTHCFLNQRHYCNLTITAFRREPSIQLDINPLAGKLP